MKPFVIKMLIRATNRASIVSLHSRRHFFSELGFMDHRETLLLQSIKDGIYHRSAYKALQKANEPKFSKPTKTESTRVNEDQ
jgi:hypothetical protein